MRSIKKGPLKSLQMGLLPIYESCQEGKMIKRPFIENSARATECLEHIHSDVCAIQMSKLKEVGNTS